MLRAERGTTLDDDLPVRRLGLLELALPVQLGGVPPRGAVVERRPLRRRVRRLAWPLARLGLLGWDRRWAAREGLRRAGTRGPGRRPARRLRRAARRRRWPGRLPRRWHGISRRRGPRRARVLCR